MNEISRTSGTTGAKSGKVPVGTQFSRQFREKNRAEGKKRVEAYLDPDLEERVVAFGETRNLSRPQAIIRLCQLGLMFEDMRRLAATDDDTEHAELARA